MITQPEILFDCYEYRTGVFLIKAYVVGRSEAGRLVHVHRAAKAVGLAQFGIDLSDDLARALQLAEGLKPAAVAARFRRGGRKAVTLPGLLSKKSKLRPEVIRHTQHRASEILSLCHAGGWAVAVNLNVRGQPDDYVTPFAMTMPEPHFSYRLEASGCIYQLQVSVGHTAPKPVRYYDWKIITSHPRPGWLVMDGRLVQLGRLAGDHIKAFLTRDTVLVPQEKFAEFFRRSIVPTARLHALQVEGFVYEEVRQPSKLRLSTHLHPFEQRYLIHPEVLYGDIAFPLADAQSTRVEYATSNGYRLTRAVRDFGREQELVRPLAPGPNAPFPQTLHPLPSTNYFTVGEQNDRYAAARWLLRHRKELERLGIEVNPPEEEGKVISELDGDISLTVSEHDDWLDLNGTIVVGDFRIPFPQFVRYIQREDRCFPLPDGTLFLIPEEWFARYRPGLRFAKVEKNRARVTRAHSSTLAALGVEVSQGRVNELIKDYAPSDALNANLRPYQLEGTRWLVKHYHQHLGACLADDMGLGKTLQTIAALVYAKEQLAANLSESSAPMAQQMDLFAPPAADESFLQPLRALVVLPASLVHNWRQELKKFAPGLTVLVHTGSKRRKDARVLRRFDVILTTYQTALRDQETLQAIEFTYAVLDESQQIKNRQSKVFRALSTLNAAHRISLSGTPIENSLSDLWSQMHFINPGLLRGYTFFKKEFIDPIEQDGDELRKVQLRELISPHLLRRTKREVAPDLPELDTQLFYCEMTNGQRRAYERELSAARNALLGKHEAENGTYRLRVIQTLTRLRQLSNHPALLDEEYDAGSGKFQEVLDQWRTVRSAGNKVLIFSSFVSHLELFRGRLQEDGENAAWLTGSVAADERTRQIDRFQNDPNVGTFLISIKAGGTGLNLTAADYVFILDPWWNPSIEDQAIARAHRIGRQGNVFARKFITKGTIEEKINRLQLRKKRLSKDMLAKYEQVDFDRSELTFLLTEE